MAEHLEDNAAEVSAEGAAQSDLGSMYREGLSVPQDYVEAYMWFNLAAAQGHGKAKTGYPLHSSCRG